MRIRTQCRECGLPFAARLDKNAQKLECPGCDVSREVAASLDEATTESGTVSECRICGCEYLYRQKDVNRAWGCGLVILGAIFVPWTYGLSFVALALVDLWLYKRLGEAVVCYRCDTAYRDAKPTTRQGEFDLLKHDVVKYGKTWETAD